MSYFVRQIPFRGWLMCICISLSSISHSQCSRVNIMSAVVLPFSYKQTLSINMSNVTITQVCNQLHKLYGLNFMMNDSPRAVVHNVDITGTLWQVLNQIGSIFDYAWKYDKSTKIITLTRDFYHVNDAPQTNLSEMQRMAALITKSLTSAIPKPPSKKLITKMATMAIGSLSPYQIGRLQQKSGVAISEMPYSSQTMFENLITECMLYPAYYEWSRIQYVLAHPVDWTVQFTVFSNRVNGILSHDIQIWLEVPVPLEKTYELYLGEYTAK